MRDALIVHRLQFAFTITYHYLFPQLTMGLALVLFLMKTQALRTGDPFYDRAARFWAKIFGINFAMGVVTGIPMEFQFGTNWADFSQAAGAVIGQTLALEGVFSFFLESSFLGLFLWGEARLGPRAHWATALAMFVGSWASGYFIVATDAWMQHPVGQAMDATGKIGLGSLPALLLNPWALWQYAHTMSGAVITGSFVVAGVGAFYLLAGRHGDCGRMFVRWGVSIGLIACVVQAFPTGDQQGRMVARHQPATLAAMEGLFETTEGAPLALIGQPDVDRRRLDNPLLLPRALSFLTYRRWGAKVSGLDAFPRDAWPDNVPLLYFSYHIMVGLGTLFILLMAAAASSLWRGGLYTSRPMLWLLMLAVPFPYIANTAGWMSAEVGRQPWLIYGLMRTADGSSKLVSAGNGWFSLLGFLGIYAVLSILFLFLVYGQIATGPEADPAALASPAAA
ncbi:MAG TPA: cytochrome ubiquinol oxidase subunit I [Thermoanaerobaculia bacterium]|nr:cytochrome ubiquinol oxidase subunit I [Thermoanaerobaculia bacterium]